MDAQNVHYLNVFLGGGAIVLKVDLLVKQEHYDLSVKISSILQK